METLDKAGIPLVVWLSPILPFINDTEENLLGILDYCLSLHVKGIMCFSMGVTLRKGSREPFYRELDKHFPKLKEKYIKKYRNSYLCHSPHHTRLMSIFTETCEKYGIISKSDEVFAYLKHFESKEPKKLF
jgi:DNA repair photolyase